MSNTKTIYPISYLGKTYNTTIHKDLTDEEFKAVKKEYYTKPDFEDVKKQFIKLSQGGVKTNYITNYYVKDLMAKVRICFNNWTIEEVLDYKPLVEWIAGKVDKNKKIYPDKLSLGQKAEIAFRLCGFKVASKPCNFPVKTVDEILQKYNINDNYYDFSCGWGSRLLSSLKNNINYFGTDPNYILCERLLQMAHDYKEVCENKTLIDIRSCGSENHISEWDNKIGVAFSSPPYYCLEDYQIGKQSFKEGITYQQWLTNYMIPTIQNINTYLVSEGFFCINIKSFQKYDLCNDVLKIAETQGFVLYDTHTLKNISRCHGHEEWQEGECGWNDNSENIFIFKKAK